MYIFTLFGQPSCNRIRWLAQTRSGNSILNLRLIVIYIDPIKDVLTFPLMMNVCFGSFCTAHAEYL